MDFLDHRSQNKTRYCHLIGKIFIISCSHSCLYLGNGSWQNNLSSTLWELVDLVVCMQTMCSKRPGCADLLLLMTQISTLMLCPFAEHCTLTFDCALVRCGRKLQHVQEHNITLLSTGTVILWILAWFLFCLISNIYDFIIPEWPF